MHEDASRGAAVPGRVLSIEMLRGITIAFRISINDSAGGQEHPGGGLGVQARLCAWSIDGGGLGGV